MNAGEKIAWAELVISLTALVAVTALYPWLGDGATGAFGLLGLLGFTVLFLKRRNDRVVFDERDRDIQVRGTQFGVHAAWMMLFMFLIGLVLWSARQNQTTVPVAWLVWLVWVQFAVCYAVKGLVEVVLYRGGRHAS